ncbi:hypothetical protein TthSNM33_02170 [Thermus thermophilus]|nr:hypothetical protein TthSNM17_02200 [Thermus thermophilus]BDG23023.1 hypothetical protein TthSNM33_02170 [Thermus thermophilus]
MLAQASMGPRQKVPKELSWASGAKETGSLSPSPSPGRPPEKGGPPGWAGEAASGRSVQLLAPGLLKEALRLLDGDL